MVHVAVRVTFDFGGDEFFSPSTKAEYRIVIHQMRNRSCSATHSLTVDLRLLC
jgi:hypothetical protein